MILHRFMKDVTDQIWYAFGLMFSISFLLMDFTGLAHSQDNDKPAIAVDQVLEDAVKTKRVTGVVAMISTSQGILYQHAAGFRNIQSKSEMTIDTVMQIASMTKAITSVGVMQLVEKGLIDLDKPIGFYLPRIKNAKVLAGFDADGKQILKRPNNFVTVRQLLTHTSGYAYEIWNNNIVRNIEAGGSTSIFDGSDNFIEAPLAYEAGTRWEYGISTDILGILIEVVSNQKLDKYFADHIFKLLKMKDTWFRVPDHALARRATIYSRDKSGALVPLPLTRFEDGFLSGGAGLSSTAPDYTRFLQALLRGGELAGSRILRKKTVDQMAINQIGDLNAGGPMLTTMPSLSNDFDFFPESHDKFGLGFLINTNPVSGGRSASSLAWAGIFNTYYWIDREKDIVAVFMVQLSPFFDEEILNILNKFERAVYRLKPHELEPYSE